MVVLPSQGLDGGRASRLPGRTRRPRWIPATSVVCLLALVMATTGTSALAAAPAASDEALAAEARKHYEEGTKAFNLAEFPRAIAEFKAAYNAKPDPLLLFNIAQAFRLGGDDGQALLFYKSFLRNMPDAPNRKEVEARIRTLEKAVAEQQRQAEQQKRDLAAAAPPAPAGSPAATTPPAIGTPPTTTPNPTTTPASGAASRPTAALTPPASHPPGAATPAPIDLNPSAPPIASTDANPSRLASAGGEPAPTGAPAQGVTDGRDTTGSSPFYKRAWFWVAVGAVVVVSIAVAGNADKPPTTALGLYAPTFK